MSHPFHSPLPPPTRHITAHNPQGLSTLVPSSSTTPPFHGTPSIGFTRSYTLPRIPVPLTSSQDLVSYSSPSGPDSLNTPELVSTNESGSGVTFLTVDMAPGAESDMHRTASVDFVVGILGRMRMELDSGETVELGPGDQVIQRGTMHKWYNVSSTEPARFVAVLFPTEPYTIPGTGELLKEVRNHS